MIWPSIDVWVKWFAKHFKKVEILQAYANRVVSGKPRTPVAGEVPTPLAPPPGCAFHPRCPHADERCRRERPQFTARTACHAVEERRI